MSQPEGQESGFAPVVVDEAGVEAYDEDADNARATRQRPAGWLEPREDNPNEGALDGLIDASSDEEAEDENEKEEDDDAKAKDEEENEDEEGGKKRRKAVTPKLALSRGGESASLVRQCIETIATQHYTLQSEVMLPEALAHALLQRFARDNSLSPQALSFVLQSPMTELKLTVKRLPSLCVHQIATVMTQLESLSIENCKSLVDVHLRAISRMPNLTSLSVSGCFKLTDKALLHIGQNANALRSLDISSLKRITDQGLIDLAHGEASKQLEELNVSASPQVTAAGLAALIALRPLSSLVAHQMSRPGRTVKIVLAAFGYANMSKDELKAAPFEPAPTETIGVSWDEVFHALRQHSASRLQRFEFSIVRSVEIFGFSDLDLAWKQQRRALSELQFAVPASNDALAALLAHCSSLVSVKVPMLCSASLKAFVKARGGCLRELDLSDHELTDDLTPLREIRELETLVIGKPVDTKEALRLVLNNKDTLRHVTLGPAHLSARHGQNIQRETPSGLVAAVLHNCSQLRSLTIAGSSYMMANHDDAFLAVPGPCGSLEKLTLRGPYGLTDKAIARFPELFPNLKELTLRNSLHRFSNRSLALLRPMGQHLVRLDLGGYKRVTADALPFVLKSFPHLTLFDTTGWLEVPAKTHQKYLERFQRRGVETTVFNDTWYHPYTLYPYLHYGGDWHTREDLMESFY